MTYCRDHRLTLLTLILKKKGILSSDDIDSIENYVDIMALLESKGYFSKEERIYVEKATQIVKSRRPGLRLIAQKVEALERLNFPEVLKDYHEAYLEILRGMDKKYGENKGRG